MMYIKKALLYLAVITCHHDITSTPSNKVYPWENQVDEACLQKWKKHLSQQKLLKLKVSIDQAKGRIEKSKESAAAIVVKMNATPPFSPETNYLQDWRAHLNLQKLLKLKDTIRQEESRIEKLEDSLPLENQSKGAYLLATQGLLPQQQTKREQLLSCLKIKPTTSPTVSNNQASTSPLCSIGTSQNKKAADQFRRAEKTQQLLACLQIKPNTVNSKPKGALGPGIQVIKQNPATAYLFSEQIQEALKSLHNIVNAFTHFGIDKSLGQPIAKRALGNKDLESNEAILQSLTKHLTKEEAQSLMNGDQKREIVVKILRAVDLTYGTADFADRFNR